MKVIVKPYGFYRKYLKLRESLLAFNIKKPLTFKVLFDQGIPTQGKLFELDLEWIIL